MSDDKFTWPCPGKPEELLGQPIGMYHCEYCGEMQIAGMKHLPPQFPDQWQEPFPKTEGDGPAPPTPCENDRRPERIACDQEATHKTGAGMFLCQAHADEHNQGVHEAAADALPTMRIAKDKPKFLAFRYKPDLTTLCGLLDIAAKRQEAPLVRAHLGLILDHDPADQKGVWDALYAHRDDREAAFILSHVDISRDDNDNWIVSLKGEF